MSTLAFEVLPLGDEFESERGRRAPAPRRPPPRRPAPRRRPPAPPALAWAVPVLPPVADCGCRHDAPAPAPDGAADDTADPADEEVFELLPYAAAGARPLARGARGSDVADLQRRLAAAGHAPGAADGIFGARTESALRAFQAAKGLPASGIADGATRALLPAAPVAPVAPVAPPSAPAVGGSATVPAPPLQHITVSSRALLTPAIAAAVQALDPLFGAAGLRVTLSSGLRPPEDQLRLIREQATKRGIDARFPAIRTATLADTGSWLDAWDELLHVHGYVINPPVTATSRLTGKTYPPSPHTTGTAFDLANADLDRIAAVVQQWCRSGGTVSQILIERTNGAVHVGVAGRGSCSITQK